jgi:hypothetical protein
MNTPDGVLKAAPSEASAAAVHVAAGRQEPDDGLTNGRWLAPGRGPIGSSLAFAGLAMRALFLLVLLGLYWLEDRMFLVTGLPSRSSSSMLSRGAGTPPVSSL